MPVPDRDATLLRAALLVNAVVFLTAALLNLGLQIPLGVARLRFADPIWQAGTGEAVIGMALLVAGLRGRARLAWVALWLSVLGIAVGLSSDRVQGAARSIHLVLVPLAVIVLVLLLQTRRRSVPTAARPEPERDLR